MLSRDVYLYAMLCLDGLLCCLAMITYMPCYAWRIYAVSRCLPICHVMPGGFMLSRDVYLYVMLCLEDLCCLEMFTYMPCYVWMVYYAVSR